MIGPGATSASSATAAADADEGGEMAKRWERDKMVGDGRGGGGTNSASDGQDLLWNTAAASSPPPSSIPSSPFLHCLICTIPSSPFFTLLFFNLIGTYELKTHGYTRGPKFLTLVKSRTRALGTGFLG
jgi:hypothetical protein